MTRPMDTAASTDSSSLHKRTMLRHVLAWILPCLGMFCFAALLVSPWFGEKLDLLLSNTIRVHATVQSCELIRDGRQREHAVRCRFSYAYQGRTYTSEGNTWTSESPLATPASLDRVLTQQSSITSRTATLRPRAPENARIVDERWLTTPAPWVWFYPLVIGLFGLAIYLEPATTVYKRADLRRDPVSGQMMEINGERRRRSRRLSVLWICATLITMFGCIYGLSNRVANAISLAGFSGLQKIPAQLTDCQHHFHGSSKGNDRIECDFRYSFHGQDFQRQAETIDFRLFPTNSRMDAEIQSLNQGKEVTAHVDPSHPGYAIAFISNDWIVSYAWGLAELVFGILLLAVLPGMLIYFVRSIMADGRLTSF
jgi:hypothetical protein